VMPLHLYFDSPELFDAIIQGTAPHETLPEAGDLTLITKHNGALSGRAIAMLTFKVEVDGKVRRAQAVTSIKLLKTMLMAIDRLYDDDGWPRK
jgi:hypothetical protein